MEVLHIVSGKDRMRRMVHFMKTLRPWILISFAGSLVWGQGLSTSTQQLSFRILEGGPRPVDAKVAVRSTRPWKVTTSDPDVVSANPPNGTGTGVFTAQPAMYRKPGTFSATLTITDDQSNKHTIPVTLTVVGRSAPHLTYPAGKPSGCTDVPGLPPGNAAVCVVPDENPPGTFTPPGVGVSYMDPNFGARVRVLSGPPAMHGYSTPSPVSAMNRYALVAGKDETLLTEIATGKVAKKLSIGVEGALWDALGDNYVYTFSGAAIRKLNVTNGRSSTAADYGKAPYRFRSISSGGTGEISGDNWISFFAPEEHQICALDLQASKTYCAAFAPSVNVDYTTMSKGVDRTSGMRYVLLIPKDGTAFYLYNADTSTGRLELVGRGPESIFMDGGNRDGVCDMGEPCVNGGHSDTTQDSSGNQWLMLALEEQSPCGYSIYSLQLNKGAKMGLPAEFGGGMKRIMQLFRCGGPDVWADYHLGCAKSAPVCVISTTVQLFNRVRDPMDRTPLRRTAYLGEIMAIKDNGAEVRRLAEHRSVQFRNEEANGYWSTPRAAISADGSLVIATSNFGFPNQRRVIVVDTGLGAASAR